MKSKDLPTTLMETFIEKLKEPLIFTLPSDSLENTIKTPEELWQSIEKEAMINGRKIVFDFINCNFRFFGDF